MDIFRSMNTNPIVIDIAQDNLLAPGQTLDFSDLKEGPAIILTNSAAKSYGATRESLRGLRLIGPGKRTNTTGILLDRAAFIGMEDVDIGGFGEGVRYGNDTWCNTLRNVNVHSCGTALHFPGSVLKNSGENLRFFGCTFFNSLTGVKAQNAGLSFHGCAFDYNWDYQFDLGEGVTADLYGCHLEDSAARMSQENSLVTLSKSNGSFKMWGGLIHISELPGHEYRNGVTPFIDNAGIVHLDNVRITNVKGDSIVRGEGKTTHTNLHLIESTKHVTPREWWQLWKWCPILDSNQ